MFLMGKKILRRPAGNMMPIRAATINPAVSIGAESMIGSLETGKYANIVIADMALNRRQVILKGVSI